MRMIQNFAVLVIAAATALLVACASDREPLADPQSSVAPIYFPAGEGAWESISPVAQGWDPAALEDLFEFARTHNSSGLVILKDGRIVAERQWVLENPPVMGQVGYRDIWYHGDSPDGWAREDVASTQKSFISVLAGIARDKGLLDFDAPVSAYLGEGWSKASPEEEAIITVHHLLSMTSGLSEDLDFVFPAGTDWAYINKAYSLVNDVLQVVTGQEPNEFTHDWLTQPMGMSQTEWIVRGEFFRKWNMNGLVTTARDLARFGLMVQADGQWNGRTIISAGSLEQALSPSSTFNPSYGLLWWLNNPQGWRWVRNSNQITPGKMIPAAPADLAAAMGTSERRLYIVPSLGLVVARTGSTWKLDSEGNFVDSRDFDVRLWELLAAAMP